jgi:hypothetical protein
MGTYPGLLDFAKPTSRLAFWRHIPQHEGRPSVATAARAILCTPFGRKVASLLASDGGIDYHWGLEGCGPSQLLPRRESRLMFFFLCLTRTGRRVVLLQPGTDLL